MNILVTGGAGYIGSKVAYDLIDNGHNVFIVDNLSTGKKTLIPKKSFFKKIDISSTNKLTNLIKINNIKAVYHFAALTSVPESLKKPKSYYKNNYLKSKALIDICIKNNVDYFIYSSTAAVYQDPKKKIKIKENFKKKPKNLYGLSKLLVERYIEKLNTNTKFCILRYFNVAGADKKLRTGQVSNNSNLFKSLIKSILKKQKIFKINGNNYSTSDGTAVRDFIHIEDLSDIHIKALNYLRKKLKKKILILNCGYGTGHSIYEIVSIVKKKYKLNYLYSKRRKGDIAYVVANCNKLKQKLMWKPKFNSVEKMIESAVMWEKKL